ncbi:MAG: hypothetical protein ABGW81_03560 [Paracoccaceae bacterium]
MYKKIIAIVLSAGLLAGCNTMGQSTLLGATAGAVGAAAVSGTVATGALFGAGIGAGCHYFEMC